MAFSLSVDWICARLAARGGHATLLQIDGFVMARWLNDTQLLLVGATQSYHGAMAPSWPAGWTMTVSATPLRWSGSWPTCKPLLVDAGGSGSGFCLFEGTTVDCIWKLLV